MCRPVGCEICGKTTWAGCGDHVESVRSQVPAQDWCPGHGGNDAQAQQAAAAPTSVR